MSEHNNNNSNELYSSRPVPGRLGARAASGRWGKPPPPPPPPSVPTGSATKRKQKQQQQSNSAASSVASSVELEEELELESQPQRYSPKPSNDNNNNNNNNNDDNKKVDSLSIKSSHSIRGPPSTFSTHSRRTNPLPGAPAFTPNKRKPGNVENNNNNNDEIMSPPPAIITTSTSTPLTSPPPPPPPPSTAPTPSLDSSKTPGSSKRSGKRVAVPPWLDETKQRPSTPPWVKKQKSMMQNENNSQKSSLDKGTNHNIGSNNNNTNHGNENTNHSPIPTDSMTRNPSTITKISKDSQRSNDGDIPMMSKIQSQNKSSPFKQSTTPPAGVSVRKKAPHPDGQQSLPTSSSSSLSSPPKTTTPALTPKLVSMKKVSPTEKSETPASSAPPPQAAPVAAVAADAKPQAVPWNKDSAIIETNFVKTPVTFFRKQLEAATGGGGGGKPIVKPVPMKKGLPPQPPPLPPSSSPKPTTTATTTTAGNATITQNNTAATSVVPLKKGVSSSPKTTRIAASTAAAAATTKTTIDQPALPPPSSQSPPPPPPPPPSGSLPSGSIPTNTNTTNTTMHSVDGYASFSSFQDDEVEYEDLAGDDYEVDIRSDTHDNDNDDNKENESTEGDIISNGTDNIEEDVDDDDRGMDTESEEIVELTDDEGLVEQTEHTIIEERTEHTIFEEQTEHTIIEERTEHTTTDEQTFAGEDDGLEDILLEDDEMFAEQTLDDDDEIFAEHTVEDDEDLGGGGGAAAANDDDGAGMETVDDDDEVIAEQTIEDDDNLVVEDVTVDDDDLGEHTVDEEFAEVTVDDGLAEVTVDDDEDLGAHNEPHDNSNKIASETNGGGPGLPREINFTEPENQDKLQAPNSPTERASNLRVDNMSMQTPSGDNLQTDGRLEKLNEETNLAEEPVSLYRQNGEMSESERSSFFEMPVLRPVSRPSIDVARAEAAKANSERTSPTGQQTESIMNSNAPLQRILESPQSLSKPRVVPFPRPSELKRSLQSPNASENGGSGNASPASKKSVPMQRPLAWHTDPEIDESDSDSGLKATASSSNSQHDHASVDSGLETWMVPHRHADDSSWVNPIREVDESRKKRLVDGIEKRSVTITIPEVTGIRQFSDDNDVSTIGQQSVVSGLDRSNDIVNTTKLASIGDVRSHAQITEYSWAPPSSSAHHRSKGIIEEKTKNGKDYRFSYIAATHTHSTASYSDAIREKFFPNQDNPIWEPRPYSTLESHLASTNARGANKAEFDEGESWMPPDESELADAPPVATVTLSAVTAETDWAPSDSPSVTRTMRVDFTGKVTDDTEETIDSQDASWGPETDIESERGPQSIQEQNPKNLERNNEISKNSSAASSRKSSSIGSSNESTGSTSDNDEDEDEEEEEEDIEGGFHAPLDMDVESKRYEQSKNLQSKESADSDDHDEDDPSLSRRSAMSKQEYVTSSRGRLTFAVKPQTIIIEESEDERKSRGQRNGPNEMNLTTRLTCCLIMFCVLLIPAAAALIYFLVFRDDVIGPEPVQSFITPQPTPTFAPVSRPDVMPVQSPSLPSAPVSKPIEDQNKPSPPIPTSPPVTGITTPPVAAPPVAFPPVGLPPTGSPPTADVLLALLSRVSFDNGSALLNPSSPQFAAMQWIRTPNNQGIYDDKIFLQRYALATLYFSTAGDQWAASPLWLTDASECEWYSESLAPLTICDSEGNLTELNLAGNDLRGTIPPELALLSNSLETLHLSRNNLSGTIPTTLTLLTKLNTIQLSENDLVGNLPENLETWSNLRRLVIAGNNLQSSIPSSIGSLRSIQQIDLSSNALTGRIPFEMALLTNLGALSVRDNLLTGSIPIQFQSLRNLRYLYLDNNEFVAPIPSAFCNPSIFTLTAFWADCMEVQCECCTRCCGNDATAFDC